VKTLLIRTVPFQVLELDAGWMRVQQGDSYGWVRAGVFVSCAADLPAWPNIEQLRILPQHQFWEQGSSPDFGGGLFTRLRLDALVQDRELIDKMKHPFYRDRIQQYSRRWGPIYNLRTRFFYVKGVRLAEPCKKRLQINLAKRRIFYKDVFGELWPEDVMRQVVRTQTGLLGSEVLFAKGQQYYLEVALVF
jgi:hypothetical protein